MNTVNRAVVVVKPKQPLVDWANSIQAPDELPADLEHMRVDCNTYLIDDIDFDEDGEAAIRFFHPLFFQEQLYGYCTEESRWPADRDYHTFREWFEVEVHSLVIDLGSVPLAVEDL